MSKRKQDMPTYEQACNVVSAMILGAKVDMINLYQLTKNRKLTPAEKKRFSDARSWLLNGNGGLEFLLSGVDGLDLCGALSGLKQFATSGFKTEIIDEFRLGRVNS